MMSLTQGTTISLYQNTGKLHIIHMLGSQHKLYTNIANPVTDAQHNILEIVMLWINSIHCSCTAILKMLLLCKNHSNLSGIARSSILHPNVSSFFLVMCFVCSDFKCCSCCLVIAKRTFVKYFTELWSRRFRIWFPRHQLFRALHWWQIIAIMK